MPARSIASQIYPHLPSADSQPCGQRQQPRLADAMYPHLRSPPDPKRGSKLSLAELVDADPWLEQRLAIMGLRRVR